jgi:RHS repeat-associated protein
MNRILLPIFSAICILLLSYDAESQNIPMVTSKPAATTSEPGAFPSNGVRNYIRSYATRVPFTDTTGIAARPVAEVQQTTDYFDGLGRPVQTVYKQVTPLLSDKVLFNLYDTAGRQAITYIPYVPTAGNVNDGLFKLDAVADVSRFYNDNALNPGTKGEAAFFFRTEYEPSPLNRVSKTYSPGRSWAKEGGNRPKQFLYKTNLISDSIRQWTISGSSIPTSAGIYPARQLDKFIVIDQKGGKVIEFKDKEGHLIASKIQSDSIPGSGHMGWQTNYYIYDDFGNLRVVISPKGTEEAMKAGWVISNSVAYELCFIYRYDERNRNIVMKAPGQDSVELVYDKRDRLIMSRNSTLRKRGQWTVFYFDSQNRPRMTGVIWSGSTRTQAQSAVNSNPSTPDSFIPGVAETSVFMITKSYYDDYSYPNKLNFDVTDIGKVKAGTNLASYPIPSTPSTMTRGLLTGTVRRVETDSTFLITSSYYDKNGLLIQTVEDNPVGGKITTNYLNSFSGKLLSKYVRFTNPRSATTPEIRLMDMFHYDDQGRLDSVKRTINDDPNLSSVLAVTEYDEMGRIKNKKIGVKSATSQFENQSYEYNLQQWVTAINKGYVRGTTGSNYFGQEIMYDSGFKNLQYNGNMAGTVWKNGADNRAMSYGYDYDQSNRLIKADYSQQNDGSTAWMNNKADFTVSGIGYDADGNIKSLKQIGMDGVVIKTIDSLTYGYAGLSDRLNYVADGKNDPETKLGDFREIANNSTQDYWYDSSGSLAKDKNKGIDSIQYNHIGMPARIDVGGKGVVFYQYDGMGTKLSKIVVDTTSSGIVNKTYYMGDFVFTNDTLDYILHPEGRTIPVFRYGRPMKFVNEYFIKDFQANVRAVLRDRTDTSTYLASMETFVAAQERRLFSNLDETRDTLPTNYPSDPTTNPNKYLARLNGVSGQKIGPSCVLRVMRGDTIQIGIKAYYTSTATYTSSSSSTSMATAIAQAFSGSGPVDGTHLSTGAGSPINTFTGVLYDLIKTQNSTENQPNKPRAYLNYVMYDDQFNMVSSNSGIKQVQASPAVLQTLGTGKFVIAKSGFIHIYPSNESGENVWFDNLTIVHNPGPLVSTNHYYPHGLPMAALSSNAMSGTNFPGNKLLYNSKEIQQKEFSDGTSLNLMDFGARFYDYQIGRFSTQDRFSEKYRPLSPYNYAANNPMLFSDKNGDSLILPNIPGMAQADIASLVVTESVFFTRETRGNGTTVGLSINWGEMTPEQQAQALANDPGLKLLYDMINAKRDDGTPEIYYYTTEDRMYIRNRFSEESEYVDNRDGVINGVPYHDGIDNISITPRNFGKIGIGDGFKGEMPLKGYHGMVRISTRGAFWQFFTYKEPEQINRSSVVFHELYENYIRTHFKQAYEYFDGTGAHWRAVRAEGKAFGNDHPGEARFIPDPNNLPKK